MAAGLPGLLARKHATVVEDKEPAENVQTVGALTEDPDDYKRRFTFVLVVSMGARLFQVRDVSMSAVGSNGSDAEQVDRFRRLVQLSFAYYFIIDFFLINWNSQQLNLVKSRKVSRNV